MLLAGENRNTWIKTCFSATLSNISPKWTDPGWKSGRLSDSPATTRALAQHCPTSIQVLVLMKTVVTGCERAGITTCYGLDGPGIESRWGRGFRTQTGPGAHPASSKIGTGSLPRG